MLTMTEGRKCGHLGCLVKEEKTCCTDCDIGRECREACRNHPSECRMSTEPDNYTVLTLRQPWAELVIAGRKKIETRSWKTQIRGRIAIHTSNVTPGRVLYDMEPHQRDMILHMLRDRTLSEMHIGKIIGTVYLEECLPIEELYGKKADTLEERVAGDWAKGRYAYILREPEIWKTPVQAKGNQRFWTWQRDSAFDADVLYARK